MNFSLEEIKDQTSEILLDILTQAGIKSESIFVVGLSTSEVIGGIIGQNSSLEVGRAIISTIFALLNERSICLAVQGCEHLNRALVLEAEVAKQRGFEIVDVLPSIHAGGSGQITAFELMDQPVEVEHITADAGIDIGDTLIGMHIRHVQVPLRPKCRKIGLAHITAAVSRPKKIGGKRAKYGKWQKN
ncbi:MAG: TIGR01440 family protein [Lactobacillales bacterium]|nr:TIGR01440 family protein [Lactobacillales bacterium]